MERFSWLLILLFCSCSSRRNNIFLPCGKSNLEDEVDTSKRCNIVTKTKFNDGRITNAVYTAQGMGITRDSIIHKGRDYFLLHKNEGADFPDSVVSLNFRHQHHNYRAFFVERKLCLLLKETSKSRLDLYFVNGKGHSKVLNLSLIPSDYVSPDLFQKESCFVNYSYRDSVCTFKITEDNIKWKVEFLEESFVSTTRDVYFDCELMIKDFILKSKSNEGIRR